MQTLKKFVLLFGMFVVLSLLLTSCSPTTPATVTAAPAAETATNTTMPETTMMTQTTAPTKAIKAVETASATTPVPAQSQTYSDPFAYCAAVGSIDTPDSRYTGLKMPEAIARGIQMASGAPTETPLEPFIQGSFWRCMDGKVYGCFVGANLPCDSKANTDKTPTSAEAEFCKANPNTDFIPAAVTGHDTIYEWQCKDGTAAAGKQVFQVDPQGYIAEIWYVINP